MGRLPFSRRRLHSADGRLHFIDSASTQLSPHKAPLLEGGPHSDKCELRRSNSMLSLMTAMLIKLNLIGVDTQ